jgi:hypothetical protein
MCSASSPGLLEVGHDFGERDDKSAVRVEVSRETLSGVILWVLVLVLLDVETYEGRCCDRSAL